MSEPGYYAIIPAKIRYDEKLSANAKLLYGEITSLASKSGVCWASNEYFAELYKTTIRTIQRWIRQLEESGYIGISFENSENEDGSLSSLRCISIDKNVMGGRQKCHGGGDKNVAEGGDKNVTHNNTSNKNNTSINISIAKAILSETTENYGNPEVNRAFELWKEVFTFGQKESQANRRAAYNLVRKKEIGLEKLGNLLKVLAESQKDRYAPREVRAIVDYASLQKNLPHLIMWARRKYTQKENERKGFEI